MNNVAQARSDKHNVEILTLKRDPITGTSQWKNSEWLTWEDYQVKAQTMKGEGDWWKAKLV